MKKLFFLLVIVGTMVLTLSSCSTSSTSNSTSDSVSVDSVKADTTVVK